MSRPQRAVAAARTVLLFEFISEHSNTSNLRNFSAKLLQAAQIFCKVKVPSSLYVALLFFVRRAVFAFWVSGQPIFHLQILVSRLNWNFVQINVELFI